MKKIEHFIENELKLELTIIKSNLTVHVNASFLVFLGLIKIKLDEYVLR